MEIRRASRDDQPGILAVVRRSMEVDITDRSPIPDSSMRDRYAPRRLGPRLDRPGIVCVVAECDDEVVGFAEGQVRPEQGRIEGLHVAPAHRDEGIGTDLYEHLREALATADPPNDDGPF